MDLTNLSESGFDFLRNVAEDFYKYPIDGDIDIVFAVCEYLYDGQSELDSLIDEIHLGKTNPKEILKFNCIQNINFTK